MTPPKEVEETSEWWDYTKAETPHKIQWTHIGKGWVRARLDSIKPWAYRKCGCAKQALPIGEFIINCQKER
jgi:hypothetical protein